MHHIQLIIPIILFHRKPNFSLSSEISDVFPWGFAGLQVYGFAGLQVRVKPLRLSQTGLMITGCLEAEVMCSPLSRCEPRTSPFIPDKAVKKKIPKTGPTHSHLFTCGHTARSGALWCDNVVNWGRMHGGRHSFPGCCMCTLTITKSLYSKSPFIRGVSWSRTQPPGGSHVAYPWCKQTNNLWLFTFPHDPQLWTLPKNYLSQYYLQYENFL